MGSDATPTYDLSAIGIPRDFSTTLDEDYKTGTDYTEAERRPSKVTWSATGRTNRLQLEPTGTLDSDMTDDVQVRVVRGGMPGPDGAQVVYRRGSSGLWLGSDVPWRITNYQAIRTGAAADYPSYAGCVALSDGSVVVASARTTTSGAAFQIYKRDASAKTWSSVFGPTTASDTSSRFTAIVEAPDGNLHAYWLVNLDGVNQRVALYTSVDDGANWLRSSVDVGINAITSPTHMSAVTLGGKVAIFLGGTQCEQWVSTDGGYSFSQVGLDESNAAVVDVRVVGNAALALTVENDTTDNLYARTLGDLGSNLFDSTLPDPIESSITVAGHAWLAVLDNNVVYAFYLDSNGDLTTSRSFDGGVTWAAWVAADEAATYVLSRGQAVFVRGEIIAVGVDTDSSGPRSGAYLVEHRYGGHSDLTLNSPGKGFISSTGDVYSFTPIQTLAEAGFADGGTATRTRSVDYVDVTTVGTTSTNLESISASADVELVGTAIVQVTAGTASIIFTARPVAVRVDITSTQIRAYDNSGAAPGYTTYGSSTAIEVRAVVDGGTEAATVWYRLHDDDEDREWTELTGLTGLTTGTTVASMSLNNATNTTAQWQLAEFSVLGAQLSSGLDDGIATDGSETTGLALSATNRSYLTGGISLLARGGPAVYDGTTYTIGLGGSPYAKANLLARYQSSPSRVWRSSGTSASPLTTAETLKFTLDAYNEAATRWTSEAVAILLRGLKGVPLFNLQDAGSSLVTVDLRTSVNYSHASGVVYMSESGSNVEGPWIARDALRGGYFEFANGEVRPIIGNTSGALTYGSTISEHRVDIRLGDIDGTEDTSGTGKIWPRDAVVFYFPRGNRAFTRLEIQIPVPATSPLGPEGYREIGLCQAFELHVMGRAFDRTTSRDVDHPTVVERRSDNSSEAYSYSDYAGGVFEFAYVDSPTFLDQVRDTTASPDYVDVSDNASADPAASRYAVPQDIEGIYREVYGGRYPILAVPRLPRDAGTGDPIATYTSASGGHGMLEVVYGRIQGVTRREQIGVGMHGVGDGYRTATMAIRVEV